MAAKALLKALALELVELCAERGVTLPAGAAGMAKAGNALLTNKNAAGEHDKVCALLACASWLREESKPGKRTRCGFAHDAPRLATMPRRTRR